MTIGFFSEGRCWPTQQAAVDAHFNAAPPIYAGAYGSDGSVPYQLVSVNMKAGSSWYLTRKVCGASTCTDYAPVELPNPTFDFNTCTVETAPAPGSTTQTGLPADFDYTVLGALWAFSFSVVVALYLFGRSAGSIIDIFRPRK